MFSLNDYNYELPQHLIAQTPHFPADECKLLLNKIENGELRIENKIFKDLTDLIDPSTIIFFNNSKVLKARIPLKNVIIEKYNNWKIKKEDTLSDGEIFFLNQVNNDTFEALVRPGKKLLPGTKIIFDHTTTFEILETTHIWRLIKISSNIINFLEENWQMPLPPYIEYKKELENPYQPIFAKKHGSVASPTASLHFTENLLSDFKNKGIWFDYVTLHVWIGTFKPVDVENILDFDIHQEIIELDTKIFENIANYKINWKKILAVGTTSTRTLETLPFLWKQLRLNWEFRIENEELNNFWDELTKEISEEEYQKIGSNIAINNWNITLSTKIFIYPWFKFKIIDELITNFHLPKSSLLMLVAAFMWYENMWKTYNHAIENNYQFFSFWDAMYIKK